MISVYLVFPIAGIFKKRKKKSRTMSNFGGLTVARSFL